MNATHRQFAYQGWLKVSVGGFWQPVCASNHVRDCSEMLAQLTPLGMWSTTLVLPFYETPFVDVTIQKRYTGDI